MTPEEYLRDRLDDQIKWYDKKSLSNQTWFKRLRIVEILFAICVPFLVSYITSDTGFLKVVVGAMGVVIALVSGLITLYKFQENWIEYRTTAETLKHEKYLYSTHSSPYNGDESFHLLVERVESMMSKENTNWAQLTRKAVVGKPNGQTQGLAEP